MNDNNPSAGKFSVVTETQLPHMCIWCRRPSDGRIKFVDGGLSLDTEDPLFIGVPDSALGVIYICEDCLREAAMLIGCMPPSVANGVSAQMEDLEQQLRSKENDLDRLRKLNESYRNILSDSGLISTSENDEESDSVSTESEQGSSESSSE